MKQDIVFHSCCAPCASAGLSQLIEEGFDVTLYFYGCNIHPQTEWELRADALNKLTVAYGARLVIHEYAPAEWFEIVRGYENEPEGGRRCEICMKYQLQKAARYALQNGNNTICTSLTLSPQKDPRLINQWGSEIACQKGLHWSERVWRKNNGFLKSLHESRRLGLYRQNYCGCIFSKHIREGGLHE